MANTLIGAAVSIVVALIGLVAAVLTRRADRNERRLTAVEDRTEQIAEELARQKIEAAERETDYWRRRALAAEQESST